MRVERAPVATRTGRGSFRHMRDTSADAEQAQLEAFRRLSPSDRVAMALEASDWLMAVARSRAPRIPPLPASAGRLAPDALPAAAVPRNR